MTPAVGVRDVELVKQILVKDFLSFPMSDIKISQKNDKLMAKNPFFLSGEEWQMERKTLTPAITSNKVCLVVRFGPRCVGFSFYIELFQIKAIYPAIKNTCDKMVDYLKGLPPKKDVDASEVRTYYFLQ